MEIDRLLEKYPEFKEKVLFIQVGQLSRIHIGEYKNLNDRINELVESINWKHSTDGWNPVIMVRRHLSYKEILALYGLSEICIVSSLHDGMNLVAKEYVASMYDDRGMLVLSQFTGAARELEDAVFINPYDNEQSTDKLYEALSMPDAEKKRRMAKMREVVKANNIFRWVGKILSELLKFDFSEE